MRSFFLPNWSPPDDPARPLPAEGRPWPSDDDDGVDLHSNTKETRQMENIEELLDFFLVANDETRRNVTGLMKVLTCQYKTEYGQ